MRSFKEVRSLLAVQAKFLCYKHGRKKNEKMSALLGSFQENNFIKTRICVDVTVPSRQDVEAAGSLTSRTSEVRHMRMTTFTSFSPFERKRIKIMPVFAPKVLNSVLYFSFL